MTLVMSMRRLDQATIEAISASRAAIRDELPANFPMILRVDYLKSYI
jgi:hypothetical protein